MMLWEKMSERCVLLGKTVTEDGEGGYSTKYVEAAHFLAAVVQNRLERVEEDKMSPRSECTVTSTFQLGHNDVFKTADGRCFRVTSTAQESPATFDFYQVTATEWRLPYE